MRFSPPVHGQSGNQDRVPREIKRRVVERCERELPSESNVWFNLALAALGIAAGAAIAAATVVRDPVTEGILWTFSLCVAAAGVSYLFAHREVNRGRREKRSRVIEDVEELGQQSG